MSTNRPRLFDRLKDGLEALSQDARGEITLPVKIIDTDNLVEPKAVTGSEGASEYTTPTYAKVTTRGGVRENQHRGAKENPTTKLQQAPDGYKVKKKVK